MMHHSDKPCREIAKTRLKFPRHCEERSDEAIQTAAAEIVWIASRSLSSGRPKWAGPVGSQ
jgi:hypothetical protein